VDTRGIAAENGAGWFFGAAGCGEDGVTVGFCKAITLSVTPVVIRVPSGIIRNIAVVLV